jgi:hypothetical protein
MEALNPTTYNLEKIATVERRCNVGGNHYKIQFEGIPGASNGVHASVWRNDKLVFDEDLNKCSRDDYIQQVRFKDGVDVPEVDRHS